MVASRNGSEFVLELEDLGSYFPQELFDFSLSLPGRRCMTLYYSTKKAEQHGVDRRGGGHSGGAGSTAAAALSRTTANHSRPDSVGVQKNAAGN